MAGERATTIRFSDSMYQRLEAAGELTGLPINSIVVVACLEWLDAHQPESAATNAEGRFQTIRQGEGQFQTLRQTRGWPRSLLPPGMRKGTYPFDRFSVRAKEALSMAQEEAEQHRQTDIGPEHLLLGLLRVKAGFAATVLPRFGIDAPMVEARLESPPDKPADQRLVPTSRMKQVIGTAFSLASGWQHRCVGTGHLLSALVAEVDGVVADVFKEKDVTVETITTAINGLRGTVGPED